MRKFLVILRPALACFAVMSLLCGVVYTALVTGAAQLLFPAEANGSLIRVTQSDGSRREYGSELIAQEFTKPEYLIGRPSGVSNLSPTSEEQAKLLQERIDWWHPGDLVLVTDGPFEGIRAVVTEAKGHRAVSVGMTLLGQGVTVTLPVEQLARIPA